MGTKKTHTDSDRRGQPLVLVSLQEQAQMRRLYIAGIPKWRHPFVGYIFGIPLVGLALLGIMWEQRVLPHSYFSSGPLFLTVMLVAVLWGLGPAIFTALLSALALTYLYIPPFGNFDLSNWKSFENSWHNALAILPFFIFSVIVAIIASQRESARRRALVAEQEEQERARELEATFEAIADSVIVYDLQGRILQTNAAARRLFALDTKPRPKPQFFFRFLFWRRRRHEHNEQGPVMIILDEHGQPLPQEQWPLPRILSGEELTDAHSMDVVIRAVDGREVRLNVTGASVCNSQGRPAGAVCVFRDVTERRELEQRTHDTLNALLEMAEALVQLPHETDLMQEQSSTEVEEYMPAMATEEARRLARLICSVLGCRRVDIIALNPETNILYPIVVVGLTPEQERQWWEMQRRYTRMSDSPYPEYLTRLRAKEVLVLDMTQPAFSKQPGLSSGTMLVAPMLVGDQLVGALLLDYGREEHVYSAEETALAGAVAKLAGLVIERERLLYERAKARANELALREANRRMDEFLGIAGHELRTPLTSVKGNIQLARRQLQKGMLHGGTRAEDVPDKFGLVEELLERAERQVRLQNRLVGDLLDVSRIQASKLELNMEACDLAGILREAVRDQCQLSPTRTILLKLPAEQTIPVLADADRVGQVVTNYLTNALKYSAVDQSVAVSLEIDGKMARVSVHDKGPGLSYEEQQYIWERFHQLERINVQSGSSDGLGLGLYICRTIIERHQGQVGVQSTPGEGSIFWFTLPLLQDA
jgi:signal transduction histidine kinase